MGAAKWHYAHHGGRNSTSDAAKGYARGSTSSPAPAEICEHHLGGFRQELPVSRLHILDFFSLGRFSRRGKTAILGGV
jgi:hypothetical protein